MNSIKSRLDKQKVALYFIKQNPFFGATPGRARELSKHIETSRVYSSAHSLYLSTAVNYGIPMALIITFVLFYSFWYGNNLLKKYRNILANKENQYTNIFLLACTAHSLTMIVHGLMESIGYEFIFLNLGFIIAVKNVLAKQGRQKLPDHVSRL
jgi:O-antigen ligase